MHFLPTPVLLKWSWLLLLQTIRKIVAHLDHFDRDRLESASRCSQLWRCTTVAMEIMSSMTLKNIPEPGNSEDKQTSPCGKIELKKKLETRLGPWWIAKRKDVTSWILCHVGILCPGEAFPVIGVFLLFLSNVKLPSFLCPEKGTHINVGNSSEAGEGNYSCGELLRELGMLSLEKKRWELVTVTRGNGLKLHQGGSDWASARIFFSERIVKHWKGLPREVVGSSSLEAFSKWLDMTFSALGWGMVTGWSRWSWSSFPTLMIPWLLHE